MIRTWCVCLISAFSVPVFRNWSKTPSSWQPSQTILVSFSRAMSSCHHTTNGSSTQSTSWLPICFWTALLLFKYQMQWFPQQSAAPNINPACELPIMPKQASIQYTETTLLCYPLCMCVHAYIKQISQLLAVQHHLFKFLYSQPAGNRFWFTLISVKGQIFFFPLPNNFQY